MCVTGEPCRKELYSFVIFIFLFTLNSFAFAQSPQISNGLSWLYSAQTTTGNWPEVVTSDYYSTAAAMDAVSSLDPANPAYAHGLPVAEQLSLFHPRIIFPARSSPSNGQGRIPRVM